MGAMRPQKRRRMGPDALSPSSQNPALSSKPVAVTTTSPVCVSCHRALNITQGSLVICARCASPTCAICSRTCTACPTSMPPTPYLTRSPTPSLTPPPSPRRCALSLQSANMNRGDAQRGTSVATVNPGKRRKGADEVNQESGDAWEQALGEFDLTPGCGRILCRNCCIENMESNSTTCLDCLAR